MARKLLSHTAMTRLPVAVMAAVLSIVSFAAQAEDFVVLDSSVAAMPPGTTVVATARLVLPDKGRIVLASQSGRIVTINGPYDGAPPTAASAAAPGAGDVTKLLPTLFGQADQRQSFGLVRATDAAWRQATVATLDDVLAINATDGGDVCLYDPSHPAVVHNPSHSGTMTIQAMSGGATSLLKWPKDTLSQPWPPSLPLIDGDSYLVEQAGDSAATIVTLHLLNATADASDLARVAQLAGAECRDQARLLLTLVVRAAK